MSQFSCKHVGIRASSSWARICASCEHHFGLSLSSFDLAKVTKLWYSPRQRTSNRDPASPIFDALTNLFVDTLKQCCQTPTFPSINGHLRINLVFGY